MPTLANWTWNFGLELLPNTKGMVPPQASSPSITMVDPITQTAIKSDANAQVQTNSAPWGNTMPISIGARAVVGKLIWSSDLREVPQPESTEADNTQTPRYEVDLAISFGRPGVEPDQRSATRLVNLWAQQILCFNIDDNELAAQFNGMSVTFHPGLIDALPNATVQADKGDLTPAWRNQMYAVIKNFPLWLVGLTDGLPDFVGEIFDSVESGTVITPYVMKPGITGGNHLLSESPLLYNAKKDVAYAFILNTSTFDRALGTYDVATRTEVSRVSFAASTGVSPDWLCAHDTINNLALVESGIANTTPKRLINLGTGKIVASLGKGSTHLGDDILNADPAQVEMVFKTSGDVFQTRLQGLVFYGAVLGSFLGGAIGIVWYAYDGSAMQLTAATDIGPENIQDVCCYPIVTRKDLGAGITGVGPNALSPPIRQDAYAFVAHGTKVTLIRIGNDYPPGAVTISTRVDFHIREVVDVLTFPGATVRALFIDPSDHCLVCMWTPNDILNTTYATKVQIKDNAYALQDPGGGTTGWRPVVGGVLWQILLPHPFAAGALHSTMREMRNFPIIGYQAQDSNFVEIDSATGNIRRVTPLARGGGDGFVYDGRSGSLEFINRGGNVIEHIQLHGTTDSPMPLSDIISSYMLSANYRPDQFVIDASIDDLAYGSMIDQSTDLWSMMQNLGIAYNFKYFISGSQIKFKRPAATGDGAAFTVDLDTLAASTSEPYDAVQTTFAAPSEAPGNVGITYIDKDQHYVSNTQTFRRTNFPVVITDTDNDTNVPIPIVMKSSEALRRAAVATFAQDAQNEILSFKLPTLYLAAEPVDIIRIKVNEFVYNVLVGEIILDPDWTLSTTGANRIVNANDRFRVGPDGNWISPGGPPLIADPPTPPSKPPSTSPTDPVMLDMPLLTPADNLSNAFLNILCGAAALVKTGWTGATVSTEVGSDPWSTLFHAVKTVPSGETLDALPATSTPFQTDSTTVITVAPTNFDPSTILSVSDADFRAGHNAIVVGSFGRWELIYFRDAAVVDDKVQLSTLIRGCRGTEIFTDSHAQSDPLYFVSLGGQRQMVIGQGVAFNRIGETFSERARGDNFVGNITGIQVPIEGQALLPWAPTQQKGILGSAVNAFGSTDYLNACGGGTRVGGNLTSTISRKSLITCSTNTPAQTSFGSSGGIISNIVDANLTSDDNHSYRFPAGVTNCTITFDFRPSGCKQIIDALQNYTQGGAAPGGTYAIDASNDQVTWTPLTTGIALNDGTEYTFTNTTGYFFYRIRQDSGSTSDHRLQEVVFRTKADVQSNDILLTWQRRDRLGQEFITNPQPLSESSEAYDLEIFASSAIVRTLSSLSAPAYLYTAVDQATDGFAPPLASIDVQIYQRGTNVGRGFSRKTTVNIGA